MRSLTATEFKSKCLAILDDVARSGELVVITKRGKPVAQVSPVFGLEHRYQQESLFGTVETTNEILDPALPADAWDAEQGEIL